MKVQALQENSQPRARADVICQDSGAETVLILPTVGNVKVLNTSGAFIWQRLDGRHTLREIAQALSQEYAVTFEQALEDVLAFAASLAARDMLRW